MHQVRVPAPLLSAPLVQQQVQSPDLLTTTTPNPTAGTTTRSRTRNVEIRAALFRPADARLDAHVDRMEDDRDHDCQENGTEKRPGDEIAEIKGDRGQSHQEEGGCYLFPFHWYALVADYLLTQCDLDYNHRNPAFSKVLNSDDRMIVPSMNMSAIEMNTIAGYPFCGACRVIRTISPRRHRRMRGPQVPVPRHTITVIPFTSYLPSRKGWVRPTT